MEGIFSAYEYFCNQSCRPKQQFHSTKTECCAMLVIDKGPNKGLLFDPNKGTSCGVFLLSRIFTTATSLK